MGPEDKPTTTGDILPMPANKDGSVTESANVSAERQSVGVEAGGNQPTVSPVAQAADAVSAAFVPAPAANVSGSSNSQSATPKDKKSRDVLKRRYDDEVRKIIGQYAADPYLEAQKIEKIKQNYLRDIYNRNVRLPQT